MSKILEKINKEFDEKFLHKEKSCFKYPVDIDGMKEHIKTAIADTLEEVVISWAEEKEIKKGTGLLNQFTVSESARNNILYNLRKYIEDTAKEIRG